MEYLVKIDNFGGQYSHYEGTIIEGHPDGTRWGRMCGLPHIGIICCPDATVEDTEILTQPLINIVDSDFMDDQYIHMRRSLVDFTKMDTSELFAIGRTTMSINQLKLCLTHQTY